MTFKERSEFLLAPDGARKYNMDRQWNTQQKPYKHSLGYSYDKSAISGSYSDGTGTSYADVNRLNTGYLGQHDLSIDCNNKCYSKLVEKMGQASQNANNLIEARQALGMIESRAMQIFRFASSLRKGHFGDAAAALSSPNNPKPGFKHKSKDFAGQFLEGHFGWVPLAQDIHNSLQTMSNPNFDAQKATAHASLVDLKSIRDESFSGGFYSLRSATQVNSYSVGMGLRFRINNPNAYLANQLGLINPASIVWEAVPYSFAVDWFANVGQILGSMSDFVGIETLDAYTTLSIENKLGESYVTDQHLNPIFDGQGSWTGSRIHIIRDASIVGPKLSLKPFKGFSLTRGITAISLLLQKL